MFTKGNLVVLSTCPNTESPRTLPAFCWTQDWQACVNILPGVRSMYVWKGSLQSETEVLLIIKTAATNFDRLRETLVAAHPCELPEVVALRIADGHHPYLQ